jgi:hypothetical protein
MRLTYRPASASEDGVIGRRCCGKLKILGAALCTITPSEKIDFHRIIGVYYAYNFMEKFVQVPFLVPSPGRTREPLLSQDERSAHITGPSTQQITDDL